MNLVAVDVDPTEHTKFVFARHLVRVPSNNSLSTTFGHPSSSSRSRSPSLSGKGGTTEHRYEPTPEVLAGVMSTDFHRVHISDLENKAKEFPEKRASTLKLVECLQLRKQFLRGVLSPGPRGKITERPEYTPGKSSEPLAKSKHVYRMINCVYHVFESDEHDAPQVTKCPTMAEFRTALEKVQNTIHDGSTKSYAHTRLTLLESRYNLHKLLNVSLEISQQQLVNHRDFYNVRKIDNHVHHSACMNQKHLLRFIKSKAKRCPNEEVIIRNGKLLTLQQVFESLNIDPRDLNVDMLDMHADDAFHRFDKFNLKYNPIGESRLREIFIKFNNHIQGRYLAEITKQVFDDHKSNKYQLAEYRLSIYGRERDEWDALSAWVVDNELWCEHNRWMIQIPRLFAVYKRANTLNNFQEMIDNIFKPLFEVTVDPSSHPKLHIFLQHMIGFDSVDDESEREVSFGDSESNISPQDWKKPVNPPYSMFSYYIYANITTLNQLRASRGLTTYSYRPHAGEAGDVEHLACTFLLGHQINHGLVLKFAPALQYLYYLSQIGISMSPLSNNLLFLEYEKNPFPRFFARGLNVTLSTDDPLMIHVTKEPLVEEYSVASQVWKLSSVDTCEIARNSVLQSGFEHQFKAHWLGNNYFVRSVDGNSAFATNVPSIRIAFRLETLDDEYKFLSEFSGLPATKELFCDPL